MKSADDFKSGDLGKSNEKELTVQYEHGTSYSTAKQVPCSYGMKRHKGKHEG